MQKRKTKGIETAITKNPKDFISSWGMAIVSELEIELFELELGTFPLWWDP